MSSFRGALALLASVLVVAAGLVVTGAPPARSQGADVFLNVMRSGAQRLNIFVPEFTVAGAAADPALGHRLAEVAGKDLTFSALFNVVTGPPVPAGNAEALRKAWADAAAAGAHAALHAVVRTSSTRAEAEMRLYDLTSPEQRQIVAKTFAVVPAEWRRLAHRTTDEVVFQFTGEAGIADTKIAFVTPRGGARELQIMDYDGAGLAALTANRSINMSPAWSPDTRSIAFTSFMRGYPFLYRMFPFERRPVQLLAGHLGINSSPAWSPEGRSVALTLSKDGNPEVYVLNVAAGTFRRLTTHPGIDTEPSWSPTGREIAFVSDRSGAAQVYVMDAEGTNVRRITQSGFNTQPRWSPKGDTIVYTSRQGSHDLWAVSPDGSNPRRLTAGPGDNESASWAPNGRHLVFQSTRGRGVSLFTMLADGSEQQAVPRGTGDAASPAWSPRLP